MTVLKNIPKVDKVLAWPGVCRLLGEYPRPVLLQAVREVLAAIRKETLRNEPDISSLSEETITRRISGHLAATGAASLRRVVNGTGVVIHTNLGRSPLPESVREMLCSIAFGYSNLEFDLEKGVRGTRYAHVERLLRELTGAEAALVVNNNAAAVLLALSALAVGREVIVSRGELVEIGGSFRIPDVLRQSGARLKEVGATNRTHPADYQKAVSPDTAMFLKVHPSNFAQVGFTSEVAVADLVGIGRECSVPVVADLGSGNLLDLSGYLKGSEPTVREYIRAGVDVVTFSGDKLLGGPQAGIIVGAERLLEPMRTHPLLRAVRIDKLTLAALEGTLRLYRDERQALTMIPTLRMLTVSAAELMSRGRKILRRLHRILSPVVRLSLVAGESQVGGGAMPLLQLPTVLVAVEVHGLSAQRIESLLRNGETPLVGRIWKDRFMIDLRSILDDDLPLLTSALHVLEK